MATVLPVLTDPHPLLRQRAQEVNGDTLARLTHEGFFDDLVSTMRAEDGVGIAANQVGHLHRVIVVQEGRTTRIYVNPVISSRSLRTEVETEGCLSVPGKVGLVRRPRSCTLEAITPDGQPVTRKAKGLIARIYQHEVDHLNGMLYIDRATHIAEATAHQKTPRV